MAKKSIRYNHKILEISYEIVNPNAKVDLIVLHGWGSNKNLMKQSFVAYMENFRHIYIDLPGFGNSTCNMSMTTSDVAKIVELLLVSIHASKDIIVGHSFGGKVALLLEPKLLVLLSSAGIYVPKSFTIRAKIALFKTLKRFGFSKLRKLFVAKDAQELSEYMYETFKNVVNEDFSDKFASSHSKALVCWGKDDTATPLSSGKKIAELMQDATLEEYAGDHYFFMKNGEDISKKIESKFLETLKH